MQLVSYFTTSLSLNPKGSASNREETLKASRRWTNEAMSASYLSLDVEGNTKEKWAVEAHFQDVIPVLRVQHGLWRETETHRMTVRQRWTTWNMKRHFLPRGCPLCAKLFSSKRETVDDPTVWPSSTFQRPTQAHNKVFVVQSSQNASSNVILAPGVVVLFVPGLKEGLTYYIALQPVYI